MIVSLLERSLELGAAETTLVSILGFIVQGSIILGLFNLIPIPPLDGSKVLFAFLNPRTVWQVRPVLEQYGLLILLGAMLLLVLSGNLVWLIIGWALVGLSSYLLIGYYFNRAEAANASRKAFITNRIGDFGFALAIFGVPIAVSSALAGRLSPRRRPVGASSAAVGHCRAHATA